MSTLPYRPNTAVQNILEDGWARGFDPQQTVDELRMMGYQVTYDAVCEAFKKHEAEFQAYHNAIHS